MLAQDFDSIQNNAGLGNIPLTPGAFIASSNLLEYVYMIAGFILLIMLISSGFQMIFSRGDPKAMQVAQSRITTSITGILILFASFWIVKIIGQFLGIDVLYNMFN